MSYLNFSGYNLASSHSFKYIEMYKLSNSYGFVHFNGIIYVYMCAVYV